MFRKLATSLALVSLLAAMAAPAAVAEDKLEGTANWTFNECYAGPPNPEVPAWIGTADFDGEAFDMLAWNVGTGLPFGHVIDAHYIPFNEVIAIYRDLELVLDDECTVESFQGDLLAWGHNSGLVDTRTNEYSGIGVVREAFEGFDGFAGGPMATGGTTVVDPETGAPLTASSYVEIG